MSVFIGSIPNNQKDDIDLAKDILNGNVTNQGWIEILERKFRNTFKNEPFLFNRGRESLYFFLKLLNLQNTDEVLLQAFTCVAVVSPILWTNTKPVFVDVESDSFNMNTKSLKEKITENTRVVIVQHTFGNILDVSKVREIVDNENNNRSEDRRIYIIEDCAHLFTRDFQELNIGKYSDMYFFSFSQDKSISCTQGSLMIINNPRLLKKAKVHYQKVETLDQKSSLYNAKYIVLWSSIKKNYFKKLIPFTNITIGRIQLVIYRLLGLIKKQADINTINNSKIKRMNDVQACLLLNQIKKIDILNKHRQAVVNEYNNSLNDEFKFNSEITNLLRYPILIQNNQEIKKLLLKEKIISGNWYNTPIYPLDYDSDILKKFNYTIGSCPNAEILGKQVLNLPTNIEVSIILAKKISEIVNNFGKSIKI